MFERTWRRWLTPVPGTPYEHLWRTRLTLEAQFLAWLLSVPLSLGFVALRLWGQAVAVGLFAIASLALNRALRRGASLQTVTAASLSMVLVELFISSRFDVVFDPLVLGWLALVPMLAGTLLGGRAVIGWSAAAVAVGALIVWLGRDTWGLAPDPNRALLRAVGLGVVIVVFAWRLEHERSKALWAMADADQLKRRFLANVSHELRTPMNGLLGLTEAMLHGDATPAQREGLEVIHGSGLTLVTLLNDLLDLSKMEAGKLNIDAAPVELRAMARDLTSLFSARAQHKTLSLVVVVDPSVAPWVRGDSLRLRQVLSNLLSNAVKFTAKGAVTLRISGTETLRFEVRDTGEGISAELLPRLFTSFEQGDPETTRRHGGTGLGLALSRELVALMGGKLEVDSTAGNGACFRFELALPRCEAPVVIAAPVVSRMAPSLPVLVVDDNPINAKVACALLSRLGVKTEVAINGQEAIDAVEARDFALVLMDCQMPVMDGLEATRRIRALPAARNGVRIIALTASAMTDELDSCRAAGMNDALSKPVSLATLSRVHNVELRAVASS